MNINTKINIKYEYMISNIWRASYVNGVTVEDSMTYLKSIGIKVPRILSKNIKRLSTNLMYEVITSYLDGNSTREVASQYSIPVTPVKSVLSYVGVLRSKSEATVNALKSGKYWSSEFFRTRSKLEISIQSYYESTYGYDCIGTYQISSYLYDIYIRDLNLLIEVDGGYWHSTTSDRDMMKNIVALSEGYSLVRISDTDYFDKGYSLLDDIVANVELYKVRPDKGMSEAISDRVSSLERRRLIRDHRDKLYGDPSYTGHALSDHHKYRHDITKSRIDDIISGGVVSAGYICRTLKVSRNCLSRAISEFYDMSIEEFTARYLNTDNTSNWEIRKMEHDLVESGELSKDVLTMSKLRDFVTPSTRVVDVIRYFNRSRNYVLSWFTHIAGMTLHEFLDEYSATSSEVIRLSSPNPKLE